ncbi:Protein of unknown function [Fontimonas thermophila]|uniref:DUF3450 domain-containing protein n=1 Tax=Fontimonas thermophila TaxID=1076937 RepID=A0A1I2JU16_9GAMM|nr:DUF3450 domain-containing protein [Fontimonas thermophila]SFF58342.1 Protein of unknown function [Fontimonas thermophila]
MSESLFRAAMLKRSGWAVAGLLASSIAIAQSTATLTRAVNEQVGAEQAAQQTQSRVEQLDDETRQAVAEYRATIQETESLRRYNQQLEQTIKSQLEEMQTMQRQIGEIETTAREIVPFLQKMLATLEEFVKLDMPFLPEERAKRIQDLKDMMARADVAIAEKFRRIVEAYQVEMEYGRTLETYQGKVGDRTVDMLRVGRVALMYQTLDGAETGYWDVDKQDWVEDNDYRDAVAAGLKIARKQAAPDLLVVPVRAPKEAK